jgi:hypothetical protein
MSSATIFQIQLVLGYVPWLICFGAYVWPRLKATERVAAHRAIATLHSFRFFGLVFIIPGVVGANLPSGFAVFAAYGDFATGVLAILALLTVGIRPLFWLFVAGGAVGRHIRDPDHLRASADDHTRRCILFAAASSARGGPDPSAPDHR